MAQRKRRRAVRQRSDKPPSLKALADRVLGAMASASVRRLERRAQADRLLEDRRQAAELYAAGHSFREIARTQGCAVDTAHHRVRSFFEELARDVDIERKRVEIGSRYEWLFGQLASELRLVQSAPLRAGDAALDEDEQLAIQAAEVRRELPAQTLRTRTYLVAALAKRITDLLAEEARVFGVLRVEPTDPLGQMPDPALRDMRLPDDPQRLAEIATALRGLRRLVGEEQGQRPRKLLEPGD